MPETRKKLLHWLRLFGLAALIVLLLLIFFPPLIRDTRSPGRRATCTSNLKTLALAVAMYADRYDQRMPMDSATPTLVESMKLLSNVAPSATFLHCPYDTRPGAKAEPSFKKLTNLNISYSYVPNLTWQDQPDSIVALDRIYTTTVGSRWPTNSNHLGKGGNIMFNDGHVQWCDKLPTAIKDNAGREIVLSP